MPVTPKYTWSQSDDFVEIVVDVPSLTRHKPDVFGTSALVKVVAHPYFLQLDLAHDVLFKKGVATIKSDQIRFRLPKVRSQSMLSKNFSSRWPAESAALCAIVTATPRSYATCVFDRSQLRSNQASADMAFLRR